MNTPFYAFGVSLDDEIVTDESELPVFIQAVSRGGHSTYRLLNAIPCKSLSR